MQGLGGLANRAAHCPEDNEDKLGHWWSLVVTGPRQHLAGILGQEEGWGLC